jgi:hypothetical protein
MIGSAGRASRKRSAVYAGDFAPFTFAGTRRPQYEVDATPSILIEIRTPRPQPDAATCRKIDEIRIRSQ